MRIAFVDEARKLILNVVVYNDGVEIPRGAMLESDAIAAKYKSAESPKIVPEEVPTWALLAVIDGRSKKTAFDTAVDALPVAIRSKYKWLIQRGDTFPRDAAIVDSLLNSALGLKPDQVDDLFIEAQNIADSI